MEGPFPGRGTINNQQSTIGGRGDDLHWLVGNTAGFAATHTCRHTQRKTRWVCLLAEGAPAMTFGDLPFRDASPSVGGSPPNGRVPALTGPMPAAGTSSHPFCGPSSVLGVPGIGFGVSLCTATCRGPALDRSVEYGCASGPVDIRVACDQVEDHLDEAIEENPGSALTHLCQCHPTTTAASPRGPLILPRKGASPRARIGTDRRRHAVM